MTLAAFLRPAGKLIPILSSLSRSTCNTPSVTPCHPPIPPGNYLSPILGLGAPQHAPEQGRVQALGRGQPSLDLGHGHLKRVFEYLLLLHFATITLYLDVEERRESRPGVEQNMSGQGILASIFVFVLIFVFVFAFAFVFVFVFCCISTCGQGHCLKGFCVCVSSPNLPEDPSILVLLHLLLILQKHFCRNLFSRNFFRLKCKKSEKNALECQCREIAVCK